MSRDGELRGHVATYGLTTPSAVARVFFGGEQPAARRALDRLTRSKALSRHASGSNVYYTLSNKPLRQADLHRRYNVLWFFCLQEKPSDPLPRSALEELGVTGSPTQPPPAYRHGPRIALVRVTPAPRAKTGLVDLQAALRGMQDFVRGDGFAPWVGLAREDRLRLTVLVASPDQVDEVARWLARKPLLRRVGDASIDVPTEIRQGVSFDS